VGDNRVSMGERMGHEVIVRDLKEGIYCSRLIVLTGNPGTDRAKGGQHGSIRPDKETGAKACSPRGELVGASLELVAYFLDTEDLTGCVVHDKPIPEGRTEVETIMQVLGLDEDIRVKELRHKPMTPKLLPSS
jgi:hypothetical protein